jgi:hypothetical protein
MTSWEECRQQLDQWQLKARGKQRRMTNGTEERRRFAAEDKLRILQAVNERNEVEKHCVQIAKAAARAKLLQSLNDLSKVKRLAKRPGEGPVCWHIRRLLETGPLFRGLRDLIPGRFGHPVDRFPNVVPHEFAIIAR